MHTYYFIVVSGNVVTGTSLKELYIHVLSIIFCKPVIRVTIRIVSLIGLSLYLIAAF